MIDLAFQFEPAPFSETSPPRFTGELQATDKKDFSELLENQSEQMFALPVLLAESLPVQNEAKHPALATFATLQEAAEHLPQTGTSLPLESMRPVISESLAKNQTIELAQHQPLTPAAVEANKLLLANKEAKTLDLKSEALSSFDLTSEQQGLELNKVQFTSSIQDLQLADFKLQKPMPLTLSNQAINNQSSMNSLSELIVNTETKLSETSSTVLNRPLFDIGQNISSPQWNQAVGQRMLWLLSNKIQSAEIQLDPPQLGRLDVQIRLSGEHAQINFSAEQLAAKESLELSLPKLREMLADAGFNRVDVNVSQQQHGQSDSQFFASNDSTQENNDPSLNNSDTESTSLGLSELGLVDYYA